MTIVRTAVSAVLETPATTGGKQGSTGPLQPTIPGLETPIKRQKEEPHRRPHETREGFVGVNVSGAQHQRYSADDRRERATLHIVEADLRTRHPCREAAAIEAQGLR
jgi:hypothetical protein